MATWANTEAMQLSLDRIRKGELVTFSPGRVKTDYNFHIVHTPIFSASMACS